LELCVPQALVLRLEQGEAKWLATSPDFPADWPDVLAQFARDFGPRPPEVRCPEAILVRPLLRRWVAVARVADVGPADLPPVGLGFHFVVLDRRQYYAVQHDPFLVLAAFPSDWLRRGQVPVATIEATPRPRTVAEVVETVKRGDSATLLGGAQAIVDGCRLAWLRPAPATDVIQALWTVLPTATRGELAIATFAFSNDSSFDAVVVPRITNGQFDRRYLSEEQAANYPEGRYELGVQSAAEAGDQALLDGLFARRSRAEVWRLGWWLLGTLVVLTVAAQLLKLALR
jgi:hypothetical protein